MMEKRQNFSTNTKTLALFKEEEEEEDVIKIIPHIY
jgi:hypothetical protein|tara:strand:- start:438 stop:545 length:108 start_codon:yes stop_codon:yes gene_type:complete